MITTGKLISNSIDSLGRMVSKFLRIGKGDIQEVVTSGSFGIDSRAVKDIIAIHAKTGVSGESVVIGFINKDCLSEIGENRLFSTDENGNLKQYIWLKNNGDIHFGGDVGNLTRYQELKSGFDQLKTDFNSLVTAYNSHVHITTATIGATPTPGTISPTISVGTPSTADISNSKIDKFKTL